MLYQKSAEVVHKLGDNQAMDGIFGLGKLASMIAALLLVSGCNGDTQANGFVLSGQTAQATVATEQLGTDVLSSVVNSANTSASAANLASEQKQIGTEQVLNTLQGRAVQNQSNNMATDATRSQIDANTHNQTNNITEDNKQVATTLSEVLQGTEKLLHTANTLRHVADNKRKFPIKEQLRENVSQQFLGVNDIEQRLMEALPEIEYSTKQLSDFATRVNEADWSKDKRLSPATVIKIQALLNWHNHGVGAVDGKFAGNTIKAMQTFQKARGLAPTKTMTDITWKLLNAEANITEQPVMIQYQLTADDVKILYQKKNMQYRSVREAVAEKFHMSRALLYRLNPNTKLKAGNTITVYNPGQPNLKPVSRVEVYKRRNLLIAYDKNDKIVASYPTTVGSNSPSGSYHVASRVLKPHYNSDFKNRDSVLPPGPNNPVGMVWMGLSKPSFGIHGSPQPEMISRQRSHGCVRLTNWDALALYGTMQHRAKVQFKNS